MIFVGKVRQKRDTGTAVRAAVTEAVDECIREEVLPVFFREHRREVINMGNFELDEDKQMDPRRHTGR